MFGAVTALALLPHARAMLDQERAARDAVVHATRQVSGTLRIGTEQCLGVVDATALIDRFHRRHPHVEIQFRQAGSHELIDSLRADALDVAFVCPADHALADVAVAVASWEALAVEDHVDFDPTWGVRPLTDAVFEARGLSRRVRFQVSDVYTLLDFVDRGLGAAIVPRHVSNKPQASRLVTVALPPDEPACR